MQKQIQKVADSYQELDRQIKNLVAKQKPLKEELLTYAEKHKSEFDEAFQLKFTNGTYISQRVKDTVEGTKESKALLLSYDADFAKTTLDENQVIKKSLADARLRKFLKINNLKIVQKETFAVYAG